MLRKFVSIFGGDPNKKEIDKLGEVVELVNELEAEYEALSDDELRHKTALFKERIAIALEGIQDEKELLAVRQEVLDEILPEAFATVREASKRTLGQRHYDVQLIGGTVLHRGQIAEMRTGEGKTLVATLPVYLNALTGKGVHLITVNDYLARRDARWMARIYHFLGLSVGILQMAAATENGKKAFLYDPEHESTREDQDKLRMVDRKLAYAADVVYGTNSEFGFDYLRDNMTMSKGERVQRGHHYAIVDEVDNVLIDEARTPLIISGPASGDVEWYARMAQLVRQLKPEDYEVSEKDRSISMTEVGTVHIEQLLGQPLRDPERPEDVTPEQARLIGYLEQALRAQFLFHRNKDYLVQGGKVVIVDEFTGRLMPGRRWSDGLHQAVEAKEGVKVEPENITYATITLQNYFRMYEKLAGMTGTALTEAEEFSKIYELEVLPIPTNLEHQVAHHNAALVEVQAQDEFNYKYTYYARLDDPTSTPVFWKRKDYPDIIYRTAEAKVRSLVREIITFHIKGRPLLVGTTSVEGSDRLSNRLRAEPVRRLLQVLVVRHTWLKVNDRQEDGRLISELEDFNQPLEKIQSNDLRPISRDLGLTLNPEDPANINLLIEILDLSPEDEPRLKTVIQGGVAHQVLNARKHTEESQVIAGAGAFGAVTIATNMAGRGVDIKLGGEIAEEVLITVHRVLRRAGYAEPYEMSLEKRRQALLKLDAASFGIYESEIKFFLQYFEDMEKVRSLGGLHVIGSERHESRRIDNQLRGRAARQGDPGSSRFYLSLEDDLMRMFGGEQVKNMMERLHIDDAYPLEHRMVTGIIEQSQHRVEGANFDVRKHLLEYDDVLNAQRMRIYSQRDRVFDKEDLTDDVDELLTGEIQQRVPAALEDEEGPWRLLAWLEQIQPLIPLPDGIFPTFTYRLLLDQLRSSGQDLRTAVLEMTQRAIDFEQEHILHASQALADRTGESLEKQISERMEVLDTFFDGMDTNDDETLHRAQEILDEISGLARLPVRLSSEQMRTLTEDPRDLQETIETQVENFMTAVTITRLVGAIEHRLGDPLDLDKSGLLGQDWDAIVDQVMQAVHAVLEKRKENLLGKNGQLVRELDAILQRQETLDDSERIRLLNTLAQGRRTAFDNKTHRQVQQVIVRFSYLYLAAKLLEELEPDQVMDDVLTHLEAGRDVIRRAWGESEWLRLTQNMNIPRLADLPQIAASAQLPDGSSLPAERMNLPLPELNKVERQAVVFELGKRMQTQIYRQVLLGAITELWVDYLTRVEALRISIGLEAYAQRDPLVQYKGQASQLFQNLMGEIRSAVISRIFLYTPRAQSSVQIEISNEAQIVTQVDETPKKKKRRRH
jgi:preprotein translocase subunit SecA